LALLPAYMEIEGTCKDREMSMNGSTAQGLVLGIGTGRCGSTTLTRLLSLQPGAYISHEHAPLLPWKPCPQRYHFHRERFIALLKMRQYAGDVAHWWLPYLESIFQDFPDTRVICLKRDQQETVRSFELIKGEGLAGVNHWSAHDGKQWRRNLWDQCYPDYDVKSRKLALMLYWDEYYAIVPEMQKERPGQIRVFDPIQMDSESGQKEILDFCGFQDPVTSTELRLNRGKISDGSEMV